MSLFLDPQSNNIPSTYRTVPRPHCQKNPITPITAHPAPKDTSNRLRSLLFRIPSLKPVTNGTSAFAFQNPVICIYAAVVTATFTSANIGAIFGLKNVVTELIRERKIYTKSELSALRPT